MSQLRLDVITTEERLRLLSDQWLSLLGRSGQNEPMLTPGWVLAWWQVFSGLGGRALRSCALWGDDGRLVALAPLLALKRRHRRIVPLQRLEALCSGEPEADEVYSEYIGIIAENGLEAEIAEALTAAIVEDRLGKVDEVLLPALRGGTAMPRALREAFRSARWTANLTVTGEAPFVPLPASWEAYLASLPSRRRRLVRRAEADLETWAGGPLRLHVVEGASALAEGRAILERLHASRWQAAGGTGMFASRLFTGFHDMVMPDLLSKGALEVTWLEARSEPVAALYNIVWSNRVYHYQAGRRTDIPRHLRPGYAIHAHAIRRAIALGRSEYDFMDGASQYKTDLALASRTLETLKATRPGLRHMACGILDRAEEAAQRLRPLPRRQSAALARPSEE